MCIVANPKNLFGEVEASGKRRKFPQQISD